MHKQVADALRGQFAKALTTAIPGFVSVKSKVVCRGDRLFQLKAADDLNFFLLLQLDQECERFTIEATWKKDGQFSFRVGFDLPTKDAAKRDEMRFRIAFLWCGEDTWWELAPEWSLEDWDNWLFNDKEPEEQSIDVTLTKVPTAVADAVEKIQKFVMPYFRKVAVANGHRLSLK